MTALLLKYCTDLSQGRIEPQALFEGEHGRLALGGYALTLGGLQRLDFELAAGAPDPPPADHRRGVPILGRGPEPGLLHRDAACPGYQSGRGDDRAPEGCVEPQSGTNAGA